MANVTESREVASKRRHDDHDGHDGDVQDDGDLSEAGPSQDPKVMRMMMNMGYKSGKGLGKKQQGRVEPVESSLHQGRRGLGHKVRGFEREDVSWQQEELMVEETVTWLPNFTEPPPDIHTLSEWKKIGPKKDTIDDENSFCSQETLTQVLSIKTEFDHLEGEEMRRARTRSNPYETIRGAFFLNRAAMKMANMDSLFDFMFTKPKNNDGKELYPITDFHHGELLYFADICAGPGGFSEYVLWRRKGHVKGFGFTLKTGSNDFKLTDFRAGPSEMFEPHYGVGGGKGDGDIYRADNQAELRRFIFDHTNGKGVNFVLADGGFSVEGEENIQEIRSKRLYLCQCLTALLILRPGGHFLCKLFDLFTRFSVGLVYIMCRAFDQVSIIKPVTSRPANSERYIVCKGMRPDCESIREYLHDVNLDLEKYLKASSQKDITELVPMEVMEQEPGFLNYIKDSNETIAELQVLNLKKIQAYAKNQNLYEGRQAEIRKQCMQLWEVPDVLRSAVSFDPSERFESLTKMNSPTTYTNTATPINHHTLNSIKSLYDYRCLVSPNHEKSLILGLGKTNVYRWDSTTKRRWLKLSLDDSDFNNRVKFELPKDTLIEAVICDEYNGEGTAQRKMKSVHVIDGYYLYGCDITHYSYPERQQRLETFVRAIHKPTRSDLSPVKMMPLFRLEHLQNVFKNLTIKRVKKTGVNLKPERLCYCLDDVNYFYPAGLFFVKFIAEPWTMAWSKSQGRKYYYNTTDHRSVFETQKESVASTSYCNEHSLFWSWENDAVMSDNNDHNTNGDIVDRAAMVKYIGDKMR